MSERLRNTLSLGAIIVMGGLIAVLLITEPTREDRVTSLSERIRCPVCQGESIADSPATMARDMVSLIEARVGEGATDEEIIDEILGAYTGAVLLDPPARGETLLLWLAPLLAAAAGIVIVLVWHRSKPSAPERPPATEQTPKRRRGRLWWVLAGVSATAIVIVAAGFMAQDRDASNTGVAAIDEVDLDSVSNETMEAVIAANPDNPEISGMRLALAERYFTDGDYQSAFPHYLEVAESKSSNRDQVVTALVRLAWMAYDGNGEVDAALGLLDQALALDPESTTAWYLDGQILWCGTGDTEAAAESLQKALGSSELSDDSRSSIESDLSAISAGESCQ